MGSLSWWNTLWYFPPMSFWKPSPFLRKTYCADVVNGMCCAVLSYSVMSDSLRLLSPPSSFVHGDSPGKNTGMGCHALLQGIFPTQGSNPGLLNCRQIIYHLSYQGSPRILEWVTYPFSRGSSQPRNRTGVSYIAGRFFTNLATREAQ